MEAGEIGGPMVSGIVMFQVILLMLMAANNSEREITTEDALVIEKELSACGPSPTSAAKIAFQSPAQQLTTMSVDGCSSAALRLRIPRRYLPTQLALTPDGEHVDDVKSA